MSTPTISHSLPNDFVPPLQESGSWAGKVITKVHTTASYVISSIDSMAQSILSNFIYVGTLGRYTLNDLKDYFSIKVSIENKNAEEDHIEEKNINSEPNNVLEETKSKLKRHDSKISVDSTTLRSIRLRRDSNSQHQSLYPDLGGMVKLSTHAKTPEQRLAEMEEICN